jgi:superfamily II DNA/RNA helicase
VKRERVEVTGSKAGCPGVSGIGTNHLALETAEVLKPSFSRAGIEGVLKRLKSELGFMPFFRNSERLADNRIYIFCPACQRANYIRRKLKEAGINVSWATVRNRMETRKMATTAAKANGMDAKV